LKHVIKSLCKINNNCIGCIDGACMSFKYKKAQYDWCSYKIFNSKLLNVMDIMFKQIKVNEPHTYSAKVFIYFILLRALILKKKKECMQHYTANSVLLTAAV
jgi:hypothetical protein